MVLRSDDGLLDVGCLSRGPGKGKVGLFVSLSEQLQGIEAILANLFANVVKIRHSVAGAVYHRRSGANLITKTNGLYAVSPRTLHRCDIDTKPVICLERTADVEVGIASR